MAAWTMRMDVRVFCGVLWCGVVWCGGVWWGGVWWDVGRTESLGASIPSFKE